MRKTSTERYWFNYLDSKASLIRAAMNTINIMNPSTMPIMPAKTAAPATNANTSRAARTYPIHLSMFMFRLPAMQTS